MADVEPAPNRCSWSCGIWLQDALPPPDSHKVLHPTYLIWCPTSWEEVPIVISVQGHVENTGVIVEGLLGPIAMVHILREGEMVREAQALSTALTIHLCPVLWSSSSY